jgi:hypothetical protein
MPYWPAPNLPGQTNNYLADVNSHVPWDSFVTKIDERLSAKDSIAIRYQHRGDHIELPFDASTLGEFGSVTNSTTQVIGFSYTRIFTPMLINEFRAGLYRIASRELPMDAGTDYAAKWGISGVSSNVPMLLGSPEIDVVGMAVIGDNYQRPWIQTANDYSYSDTLTLVRGAHQVKFGGSLAAVKTHPGNAERRGDGGRAGETERGGDPAHT